jgi:hypothetical protein
MSDSTTPHLGYVLHPARRHSEPGYARLEVWLSDHASGLHFDPLHIRLPVAGEEGGYNWATIDHPYIGATRLRICAGPVDVIGFGEKRLEAFTFGGELVIRPGEESTLASLSSAAPVLVRVSSQAASIFLMEEAELLLALRRGVWDEQPGEFDQRLLAADPLELYHALLMAIVERMDSLPYTHTESEQQMRYRLRQEIESVENEAQSLLRPLADIL